MKLSWKRLNWKEPAVIRGVIFAVLGLGGALGLQNADELSTQADAALMIGLGTLFPVLQAIWTRAAVWSKKGKDEAVAEAVEEVLPTSSHVVSPQRPGIADHADPNP